MTHLLCVDVQWFLRLISSRRNNLSEYVAWRHHVLELTTTTVVAANDLLVIGRTACSLLKSINAL